VREGHELRLEPREPPLNHRKPFVVGENLLHRFVLNPAPKKIEATEQAVARELS
jgi:hypothetical protein